jgi:hypothetical protein
MLDSIQNFDDSGLTAVLSSEALSGWKLTEAFAQAGSFHQRIMRGCNIHSFLLKIRDLNFPSQPLADNLVTVKLTGISGKSSKYLISSGCGEVSGTFFFSTVDFQNLNNGQELKSFYKSKIIELTGGSFDCQ